MSKDDSLIEFGSFRLSRLERSLASADGAPIQLTRRLYDTLLFMVERPGRLLEKQALLDAVWKGAVVEENTLSRTISALRQILGERAGEHRYIETVSGLGYRFVQSVTVTRAHAAEAPPRRNEPSIAVLPFEDLSRERDQGYFADGIAEELLNRLASIGGLRLIAKSSSFRLRDRAEGAQAIGRALNVDYLLMGAVRKEAGRVRITAQLIDASHDSQVWSERFDRAVELEHIFAIQDDIARAVANALSAALGVGITPLAEGARPLAEGATRDLEAYDLYLRARSLASHSGAYAMVRSAELYREAVTRDPNFAAAWLAFASTSRGRLIFAPEHSAQAIRDILEAVPKLLDLAPQWWATHLAQSWPLHLRRDWLGVERALSRAQALAPGTPWEISYNTGIFYTNVGDLPAGLEHFRAAMRSDPLSLQMSGLVQMLSIMIGRDAEADTEYRRSLDLSGDREMVEHLVLHRLWAHREAFRAQFRRYLDLTQTKPVPILEDIYQVCEDAPRALEKLRGAAGAPEYQSPPRQVILAWWLAAYGDVESALDALWRGYVDLDFFNVSWLWFPVFARVREHARFAELLERLGLAEYRRSRNAEVLSTS